MNIREMMGLAGYSVHERSTHGPGRAWDYSAPGKGPMNSNHFKSEEEAWAHAESAFRREIERAKELGEITAGVIGPAITHETQRQPGMSPLEMIEEWKRGCSIAGPRSKGIGITDAEDKPELCPDCTVGLINAMEKHLTTMLPHVRAVRLWHWQQVLEQRKLQNQTEERARRSSRASQQAEFQATARRFETQASWHLACVQALNDFLPVGDTAESNDK